MTPRRFPPVPVGPSRRRGAVLVALCAAAIGMHAPAVAVAADEPCASSDARQAVLCLVNRERAAAGAPLLRADRTLGLAATGYAQTMVAERFFAHVSPSGEGLIDRTRGYRRGADAWAVGENLAWGTGTLALPVEIVRAWMASPAHRRSLLSRRYRDAGIGLAQGTPLAPAAAGGATYVAELGVRRAG